MEDRGRLLLRMGEVADRLAVSRSQAYALARRGDLPTIRLGGSLRVPVDALERWVADETRAPRSAA